MEFISTLSANFPLNDNATKWIAITLFFFAVFFSALFLLSLISGIADPVRRRLTGLSHEGIKNYSLQKQAWDSLRPFAKTLLPKGGEFSRARLRLSYAGFRNQDDILLYSGIRILLMIGLPSLVILTERMLYPGIGSGFLLLLVLAALVVGYILPSFVLDYLVRQRQTQIRLALPDALDMIVICTEAGMGINMAIDRVAKTMGFIHPVLAMEFNYIALEIRAGVDRIQALRNLDIRTGVEDLNGFISALTQSMQYGSSIGETLRIYSDDLRDKRFQTAEELAAKLPVKMVFPLILCFVPAFFIVALGPAILALKDVFGSIAE